ncbi:MAG TPA: hypothetical protein VJQ56_13960 [Blastocatellia bacterium]|nr:hypothetical protein [Blastocatellia bacterium]
MVLVLTLAGCEPGNQNANRNANSNSNQNANSQPVFTPPQELRPTATVDPNFKPCNPYYPLVPGSLTKHLIRYSSGLSATVTIIVDAVQEEGRTVFVETLQIIDQSGGLQKYEKTVKRFACDDGRLRLLSENTENRINDKPNTAEYRITDPAIFMTDADSMLRKGSTWSYTVKPTITVPGRPPTALESPVHIKFEVVGTEDVTVPAGTFKATKVSRGIGKNQLYDFFVPGLGLVRRTSSEGTNWALTEYSGLTPAQ